jgi:hypothetical protein
MVVARSAVAVVLSGAALVSAAARAQDVVVQLPEFRQFSAPTTVLVPDRGATALGGTSGVGAGQRVFGPVPMARSGVVQRGASRMEVRAYVHDFQAMDEALLAEEPGFAPAPPRSRGRSRPSLPPRTRSW